MRIGSRAGASQSGRCCNASSSGRSAPQPSGPACMALLSIHSASRHLLQNHSHNTHHAATSSLYGGLLTWHVAGHLNSSWLTVNACVQSCQEYRNRLASMACPSEVRATKADMVNGGEQLRGPEETTANGLASCGTSSSRRRPLMVAPNVGIADSPAGPSVSTTGSRCAAAFHLCYVSTALKMKPVCAQGAGVYRASADQLPGGLLLRATGRSSIPRHGTA
jgi:hypothetical protein